MCILRVLYAYLCAFRMCMYTHRTWRKSRLPKRRCVKRCCKYRYYRLLNICVGSSRAGGARGGRKSGVAGMLRCGGNVASPSFCAQRLPSFLYLSLFALSLCFCLCACLCPTFSLCLPKPEQHRSTAQIIRRRRCGRRSWSGRGRRDT